MLEVVWDSKPNLTTKFLIGIFAIINRGMNSSIMNFSRKYGWSFSCFYLVLSCVVNRHSTSLMFVVWIFINGLVCNVVILSITECFTKINLDISCWNILIFILDEMFLNSFYLVGSNEASPSLEWRCSGAPFPCMHLYLDSFYFY